jgi:uncharacterized membrane protein HdeD (DUF308 family)
MKPMTESRTATWLLQRLYGKWWMMLLEGLGMTAMCAYALLWPKVTLLWIIMALGAYRAVMGLVYLIGGIAARRREGFGSGFGFGRGIFDVFIGLLCLLSPAVIVGWFAMLLGLVAIFGGAAVLISGVRSRGLWRVSMVLLGALLIVFGFCALWQPVNFAAVFTIILGVIFGVMGIFTVVRSFAFRKALKALDKQEDGFTDYKVE